MKKIKVARKFTLLHVLYFILFATVSCGRRYNTQYPEQDTDHIERLKAETLIRVNKQFVDESTEYIRSLVLSKGWQMKTTESGLWYMIYHRGNGEQATAGQVATLEYTLSLPDSTVCYSSAQLGTKVFRLGQGGVEAGLEEGVLTMRVGDRARMIMPPHLAHGLAGDGDCIPQRAVILYDVELVHLQD